MIIFIMQLKTVNIVIIIMIINLSFEIVEKDEF